LSAQRAEFGKRFTTSLARPRHFSHDDFVKAV
jgi:hypothetical protein